MTPEKLKQVMGLVDALADAHLVHLCRVAYYNTAPPEEAAYLAACAAVVDALTSEDAPSELQFTLDALVAAGFVTKAKVDEAMALAKDVGKRTGWPAGMLQDDDRKLSKALANTPGALRHADDAVAAINQTKETP